MLKAQWLRRKYCLIQVFYVIYINKEILKSLVRSEHSGWVIRTYVLVCKAIDSILQVATKKFFLKDVIRVLVELAWHKIPNCPTNLVNTLVSYQRTIFDTLTRGWVILYSLGERRYKKIQIYFIKNCSWIYNLMIKYNKQIDYNINCLKNKIKNFVFVTTRYYKVKWITNTLSCWFQYISVFSNTDTSKNQ